MHDLSRSILAILNRSENLEIRETRLFSTLRVVTPTSGSVTARVRIIRTRSKWMQSA